MSLWCVCSFLPKGLRPHLTVHRFGTHRRSPQCNFNGGRISGLQSFRYVQAPLLARPPGCTYRGGLLASEQPGPLPHAMNMWLPIMNCDIATCPNRAIDTVGLSPTGLRPCRPLPDCLLQHACGGALVKRGELTRPSFGVSRTCGASRPGSVPMAEGPCCPQVQSLALGMYQSATTRRADGLRIPP